MMLARREPDRVESRQWNEHLRLRGKVDPRDVFEAAFGDVLRNLIVAEYEEMKRKHPERAEALKHAPCPACFCTGRDVYLQGVLDRSSTVCKGAKRWLPR